jgi:hypothetical protein
MAILTKEAILGAKDLKTIDVSIPEWGGDIRLRTMKAWERDQFEDSMFKGKGKNRQENLANLRARFLALIIIDDQGNRIFNTPQEVQQLGNKSAGALDKLFSEGRKLNGMSEGDVEELAKNSEEGQDDDLLID